ncbi:threonine dehydratase [Streptomyces zhaozhouensis]|uniref:Threonine dehydratase n=1 Tax=Streptomyces zhaozhouensis TaxID=1300267 RepID=A0A286EAR8_9ACTN|nr:pyridoxal-phosphate dependent enzyme [Streptomyces zhaozhouensis]SOD68011.1 threonine dehydratase [Streptomyces zhaozhouensis]
MNGPAPSEVWAAAERLSGRVRRTPLLPLDGFPGLLLKAEHLQHGGSFKTRGAANALLVRRPGRVVTGSSGNHGLAVAALGGALGAGVTVVMAAGAAEAKERAVRARGATVVRVAGGVAERDRHARALAERTRAFLLPSSDHALVVAGQGTVALEVFEDAPGVHTLFVPTGGGGLLAGACLAALATRRRVRIVGVEPRDTRRYFHSLAAGRPVELPPSHTVADGLRAQRPGRVPLPLVGRRVDELVGVSDEEVVEALRLLRDRGVGAEPSGAVALAGALAAGAPAGAVAVVSGGNAPGRPSTTPAGRAGAAEQVNGPRPTQVKERT